jgi:hypothetical protein
MSKEIMASLMQACEKLRVENHSLESEMLVMRRAFKEQEAQHAKETQGLTEKIDGLKSELAALRSLHRTESMNANMREGRMLLGKSVGTVVFPPHALESREPQVGAQSAAASSAPSPPSPPPPTEHQHQHQHRSASMGARSASMDRVRFFLEGEKGEGHGGEGGGGRGRYGGGYGGEEDREGMAPPIPTPPPPSHPPAAPFTPSAGGLGHSYTASTLGDRSVSRSALLAQAKAYMESLKKK